LIQARRLMCVAAAAVCTLAALPAAMQPRADAPVLFHDATSEAGLRFHHLNGATPEKYLVETMGSGGLFFDFNNDGWLDIFLVNGGSLTDRQIASRSRHALYRNRGNGTFEDVTAGSGIVHAQYGMGGCAGDYDNDGWVDLYVTNFGPNALYRNNGNGTFTSATRVARVGSPLWSTSCAFADLDNDGYLDLFVANYVDFTVKTNKYCADGSNKVRIYCHPNVYKGAPNVLYRNQGNGTFTDVTRTSGTFTTSGKGLGVVVADYDGDGWPDVFVANDSVPNFLYRNQGKGVFKEVGLLAGVAVASDGRPRAGMGTDFGDYDGDGLLDLIVTNLDGEAHSIFRNLRDGFFTDATEETQIGAATLPFVGFGVAFFDADNNGDLNIAIANGNVLDNARELRAGASYAQRKLLFRNEGRGRFREIGRASGPGFGLEKVGRGLAAGDIDNDGDPDLLVTNNGQTADLLRNDGRNRQHSLLVRTVGTRSNRDGVGARLRLTAGGATQLREVKAGSGYLGQNDLRVHFGVGAAKTIDRLEIRWPSGTTDLVTNLPANQIVTVREGEGVIDRRPFGTSAR
jgi:enediyne biosynthesis protein E4